MADDSQLSNAIGQAIAQGIGDVAEAIRGAFPNGTGTATSAVGGGAVLPATPSGFITTTLPGTTTVVAIPYYNL